MSERDDSYRALVEVDRSYIAGMVNTIMDHPESDPTFFIEELLEYGQRCIEEGRSTVPLRDTNIGSVTIDAADICSKGTVSSRKLSQKCARSW